MSAPLLQIRNLTKQFPAVLANDNISLDVNAGEVVALLGENGAGKSTLVKMVFGLVAPTSGEILVKGELLKKGDTSGAIRNGIGMVHQHFQLVPVMTVAENMVLGSEPKRGMFLDIDKAIDETRQLSEKYGLDVDPTARIEDLPVGTQQRVEILKALRKNVDLLILDEPTAVLTPQETDELLEVMRNLAKSGVGVVFITHKLREVMAVADRVVVLRAGKVVGSTTPKETDQAGLAQMMVGRSVVLRVDKTEAKPKDVALEVQGLHVNDDRGHESVKGVDLQVRAGEILGIAGVEGNGQHELVEAVCGMRLRTAGTVRVVGKETPSLDPKAAHDLGVSHIPQDRELNGMIPSYTLADNVILNRYDEPQFTRGPLRDRAAVEQYSEKLLKEFDVRASGIFAQGGSLSGGNKQKLVVARELSRKSPVLIASQPTRGVDVGSIEFIHNQLIAARDAGQAVLLVSAELDEILSLSDRIAVMYGGKIVAVIDAKDADRQRIGRLMAGLSE